MVSKDWMLVVGGSRGLGASAALHLAVAGRPLVVTYHSASGPAEDVCRRAGAAGAPDVRAIRLDLGDPYACERAVAELIKELGPPSVLVHSAAHLARASLAATSVADFETSMRINCTSAYAIARTCGLAMRGGHGGSITLLSSVIGPFGVRDRVAYAASKAGVIGLTKAMAVELAPTVRVNAVMLGTFATDMNKSLMGDESALSALSARVPLGRLGEADEVGRVVALLAQGATFVTGAVWEVDGGITARLATPSGDLTR